MNNLRYTAVMASVAEGMVLELWDRQADQLALDAFYSDTDGSIALTSYRSDVPLDIEEWFRAEAARRLPPLPEVGASTESSPA